MQNNFFKELIQRLFSKNPKFFKYIQYAMITVAAVSTLLSFLQDQHVSLPSSLSWLGSVIVKISAGIAWIMAQLPVPSPGQK